MRNANSRAQRAVWCQQRRLHDRFAAEYTRPEGTAKHARL
jgi:hypothetical protein